jgi:ferredoxin
MGGYVRVIADKERCQGHARCNAAFPDLFPQDDQGFIAIDAVDIPPGREADGEWAVASCPEEALRAEI